MTHLDITHANISQTEADRLGEASVMPVMPDVAAHAMQQHQPGDTEPWISRLVGDFVVAKGARTVLETGSFQGATSVYIYDALMRLGGGTYYLCELDRDRVHATATRLQSLPKGVDVVFSQGDVLQFLRTTDKRFDLAWVDDNHEKPHVSEELRLLYPKMNKGGLILLHDVFGVCDLRTVVREYGGYSIDLPRLGPAGGIGVIQT